MGTIIISDLALHLHIGVTEREQRRSQKILISMDIEPEKLIKTGDSLENTIDYSAVRQGVKSTLRDTRFNLIETVADRVARYVLDNFKAKQVSVTVKKFPYRDTAHVGCRLTLGVSDGHHEYIRS
jgi:FolB domain-containing protein